MQSVEQKSRRPHLRFTEREIQLALTMLEKLEKTIEILYYLMEREDERPFVMVMVSAEAFALKPLLQYQKRDTDLLYEIDKEQNLYVVICQETKVDGGYHFAQRLMKSMTLDNAKETYCVELEVRSAKYEIKEVIFKLVESYIKAKQEHKEGEIVFKSLY
jgi:recombinational DNA repair protein RecR